MLNTVSHNYIATIISANLPMALIIKTLDPSLKEIVYTVA